MNKDIKLNDDKFISSKEFREISESMVLDTIDLLLLKEQPFMLRIPINKLIITPELPAEFLNKMGPVPLFAIKNFSFETFHIIEPYCIFKTGFGNIETPFEIKFEISDIHIILTEDNIPLVTNITAFLDKKIEEVKDETNIDLDIEGINKSMFLFMSNEQNEKFFKK